MSNGFDIHAVFPNDSGFPITLGRAVVLNIIGIVKKRSGQSNRLELYYG